MTIKVSKLLTLADFELKNSDKFSVVFLDDTDITFRNTDLETLQSDLMDRHIEFIKFIQAV